MCMTQNGLMLQHNMTDQHVRCGVCALPADVVGSNLRGKIQELSSSDLLCGPIVVDNTNDLVSIGKRGGHLLGEDSMTNSERQRADEWMIKIFSSYSNSVLTYEKKITKNIFPKVSTIEEFFLLAEKIKKGKIDILQIFYDVYVICSRSKRRYSRIP